MAAFRSSRALGPGAPAAFLATAILLVSFLTTTTSAARDARQLAADPMVPIPDHIMWWANAASYEGPADPADGVHALLHLGYSDPAAVEALADAISYPDSPEYGKFLTVAEFTARFAASQEYVDRVVAYFESSGLHITYVPRNRKFIGVDGTVGQFSRVFEMSFGMYTVNDVLLRSPSSEPMLPASLVGPYSLIFHGLDQGSYLDAARPRYRRPEDVSPSYLAEPGVRSTFNLASCIWTSDTTYVSDATLGGCGYRADQIRAAYAVPYELTGKGQKVAVIDAYASPFIQSDLDQYSAIFGLPSTQVMQVYPPFNLSMTGTSPPGFNSGWQAEESLDIEIVHGIAPGATIYYLGGASSNNPDLLAALNYVIEAELASFVTNSYGSPLYGNQGLTANNSDYVNAITDIAMQGAIVGVGIYASSGDNGDASETYYYPGYEDVTTPGVPAADPYITAVGGTTLALGLGGYTYIKEYGWGEERCSLTTAPPICNFLYGSGGGVANTFRTPRYQQNTPGAKAILAARGFRHGRVVPDVAALADPYTGFIFGLTTSPGSGVPGKPIKHPNRNTTVAFQISVIGGTSLASPLFTALMALKQELTGKTYGFANPLFYHHPRVWRDILDAPQFQIAISPLSVKYAPIDESLVAGVGYDNITGLGTPGPLFWSRLP